MDNTNIIADFHSTLVLIKALEAPPQKGMIWENLANQSPVYADLGKRLSQVVYGGKT